jgi:hypothetical protein
MPNELDPIVGNWYTHLDKGQRFVVIDCNEDEGIVELQHFDGDIEQIGLEDWRAMRLELSEAPENWSGPVDNLETDDSGFSETDMTNSDWRESLEEVPREPKEAWEDSAPEDERDDWDEGATSEELWDEDEIENSKWASLRDAALEEGDESEEEL